MIAFRWKSRIFLSCGAISHVEEPGQSLLAFVTEQTGVYLLSYYSSGPLNPTFLLLETSLDVFLREFGPLPGSRTS